MSIDFFEDAPGVVEWLAVNLNGQSIGAGGRLCCTIVGREVPTAA